MRISAVSSSRLLNRLGKCKVMEGMPQLKSFWKGYVWCLVILVLKLTYPVACTRFPWFSRYGRRQWTAYVSSFSMLQQLTRIYSRLLLQKGTLPYPRHHDTIRFHLATSLSDPRYQQHSCLFRQRVTLPSCSPGSH